MNPRPATLPCPGRSDKNTTATIFLLLASTIVAPAQDAPDRFLDLFRPARTEQAALSPDGEHIAYTVREGDKISVIVVRSGRLDQAVARVDAVDDTQATPRFGQHRERVPAAVNWMKWTDNERVVLETNAQVAVEANRSLPGVIMTFSRDGSDGRVLITPRDVPALVVALDPAASISRDLTPLGPTADDPNFGGGGNAAGEQDDLATGGLFGAGPDTDPFSAQGGDVFDPGAGFVPLSPSIFDLDPTSDRHVRVRTTSESRIVLYRLDVITGATKSLADFPIDLDRQLLSDRQGTPRLSAPASTNVSFPHRPRIERGPGSARRGDLAAAAGLPAGAFDFSPENFFAHRALPLGFDEKPNIFYFASNLGRDTYGIFAADLEKGTATDLALEHPTLDLVPRPADAFLPSGTLVFDRHTRQLRGIRLTDHRRTTRWFDPNLQAAQSLLERTLPGGNVEILEWDRAMRRFLVHGSGVTNPGRFYLFDRQNGQLAEFAQRAPWLDEGPGIRAIRFEVSKNDGPGIRCQITLPVDPKVTPTPLIVVCPSNPWDRLSTDFQPEVNALARMGFAVLQYSGRGAWGLGVKHREALREGYADTQLEDLMTVLEQVGRSFSVDPRFVGLVGAGHGGFLALHAMATHPDRFRCAVAIEAPVDLARWVRQEDWQNRSPATQLPRSYYGSPEWLGSRNLPDAAPRIGAPCLILSYPGPDGSWRRSSHTAANNFARRLRSQNPESQFRSLSHDFAKGLPLAKAEVYGEIENFLNAHVYNFGVSIGESVEVP